MEDSKESQNGVHLVKSPLNFFKVGLGSFTLVALTTWECGNTEDPLDKSPGGSEVGEADLLAKPPGACESVVAGLCSAVGDGVADPS